MSPQQRGPLPDFILQSVQPRYSVVLGACQSTREPFPPLANRPGLALRSWLIGVISKVL